MLARDGRRCRWCSSVVALGVHHILYRSQGGPDVEANLITLCQVHHARAHTTVAWRAVLRALIWIHYVEGHRLTVPEVIARLAREGLTDVA